jgi:hypothetical protein
MEKMFFKVFRSARKVHRLGLRFGKKTHVHQMLGIIIIVAHASEIGRVVSHTSIWHLLIALALFAVWLVTQGANQEEIS